MSVYRERDREREWDVETSRSTRHGGGGGGYSVRKYKVPDRRDDDRYEEDLRIITRDRDTRGGREVHEYTFERERDNDTRSRRDDDIRSRRDDDTRSHRGDTRDVREYRFTERVVDDDTRSRRDDDTRSHRGGDTREVREYRYEREVERERSPPPTREIKEYRFEKEVESRSPAPREVREYRFEREVERERSPSPSPQREIYRFEREVEREPPVKRSPYELERYSKSTEYFARPEPPQPIVIRADPQPIIIQEAPRQQLVIRREDPSYEVTERTERTERTEIDDDRRSSRRDPPGTQEDDYYYERRTREIERPRREHRHEDRRERRRERDYDDDRYYHSDDETYIRREESWDGRGSPGHKRHLAEGVVAGLGASELIHHHRRRQGEHDRHRGRDALASGAVGAIGGEALSRLRGRHHSRSSSSSSSDRGRRRQSRRRRQRSRSKSKTKALAGIGALAAVGAVAYAVGHKGKKGEGNKTVIERVRSISRSRSLGGRRHSADDLTITETRDPGQKNRRIAQAGLATAAVAGLVERARSKSRSRRGRSQSRIRTGGEIAAAGLGGAALAGLYEKRKSKKEAAKDEKDIKMLSRSRSRSRSQGPGFDSRDGAAPEGGALVEYGAAPVYPQAEEGRARGLHSESESSRDGSPGRHRHRRRRSSRDRSRSKSRHLAEAAALGGAAGVAAHEATKRREKRRERREREERERLDQDNAAYNDPYGPPQNGMPMDYPPANFQNNSGFYPETNQFPPPPTAEFNQQAAPFPNSPGYNPAEHPPVSPFPPEQQYNYPPPPQGDPYAHDQRYNRQDDNVSPLSEHGRDLADGVEKPSERSKPQASRQPPVQQQQQQQSSQPMDGNLNGAAETPSRSVQFNMDGQAAPQSTPKAQSNGHDTSHADPGSSNATNQRGPKVHFPDGQDRGPISPTSVASEETVDLPDRFDERGRKKAERGEDRLADSVEDILSGHGPAGRLFQSFTKDLFGSSSHDNGRDSRHGSGSRRR